MNICKLSVDSRKFFHLGREEYINMTGRRAPYFKQGADGKMRHYAVCPACDNPVYLVGLIAQKDGKLYARHIAESVPDLAEYRQDAYDNCPLAAHNRIQGEKAARKAGSEDISLKILRTLRDHFDRVILVLQKAIGIKITVNLAGGLLDDYLAEEGYRYKYASLINIPWMLAYMSTSKNLVWRIISDSALRQAVIKNVKGSYFEKNKLCIDGKKFTILDMYFSNHTVQPKGEGIEESIRMVVSTGEGAQSKRIYEKRIIFDYDAFEHLLDMPEGKGVRNRELLDLAALKLKGVPPLRKGGPAK